MTITLPTDPAGSDYPGWQAAGCTQVEVFNIGFTGLVCDGLYEHTAYMSFLGQEVEGDENRYLTGIGYLNYSAVHTMHYLRFFIATKDGNGDYVIVRPLDECGYEAGGKKSDMSNWPRLSGKEMRCPFPPGHFIVCKYKGASTATQGTPALWAFLSWVIDDAEPVNATRVPRTVLDANGDPQYGQFNSASTVTVSVPAGSIPHCLQVFKGMVAAGANQLLPLWPNPMPWAQLMLGGFLLSSTFQPAMSSPDQMQYLMFGGFGDPGCWAGYGEQSCRHNILGGIIEFPNSPGYTDGHHYVLTSQYNDGVAHYALSAGIFAFEDQAPFA